MTSCRIVLGLDGSSGSEAAMQWCIEAAPDLHAEVVAVYALPPVVSIVPMPMPGPVPLAYGEEMRELMVRELDGWCKPLDAAGVPYRTEVMDGSPADVLMRVADEIDAAMIVVGRRGHGGFAELLLGSVPNQLSHHATRPILVVPVS